MNEKDLSNQCVDIGGPFTLAQAVKAPQLNLADKALLKDLANQAYDEAMAPTYVRRARREILWKDSIHRSYATIENNATKGVYGEKWLATICTAFGHQVMDRKNSEHDLIVNGIHKIEVKTSLSDKSSLEDLVMTAAQLRPKHDYNSLVIQVIHPEGEYYFYLTKVQIEDLIAAGKLVKTAGGDYRLFTDKIPAWLLDYRIGLGDLMARLSAPDLS